MTKETLILFTGDSITDGNRYKKKEQEWDLNHQMGHSYPYIINGVVGSQFPERHFKFKNKGISGNRIIDLYARIGTDLLQIKPDVLSILVGVNDGPIDINNYEYTPQRKYEALYRMFLQEVKENLPDTKIILMEPFVCNAGKLRSEYEIWRNCVEKFAEVVAKLSAEFETTFVPLQKIFDERCAKFEPEYWSWDGIHPTENGHGVIAREWLKAASPILGINTSDITF